MEAKEPKIKGGYILYPRYFLDALGDLPPLDRYLWTYLNSKANHKDSILNRGQLITTIDDLRQATRYRCGYAYKKPTKAAIYRCLERFRRKNMIETRKTTRGLVITICDYEFYQNPANYECNTTVNTNVTTKMTEAKHDKQEYLKNDKKKERFGPPKSFYQMDCERAAAAFEQARKKFLESAERSS
jgi:hypothetical protein